MALMVALVAASAAPAPPKAEPAPAAAGGAAAEDQARCGGCHAQMTSRKFPHDGAGPTRCEACHLPVEGSGPCQDAANGKAWALKATGGALCTGCHEQPKLLPNGVKHAPVVEGRCLECHDPHGSELPGGLRAQGKALCLGCHQAPAAGEARAAQLVDLSRRRVHNPVRSGDCQDCHVQTHTSRQKALLKTRPVELCTGCHDVSGSARQHPVIEAKGCTACHDPHSSDNPALLAAPTAEQLCYSCHDRKDQRGHLHAPVASGECLGCHDPHASDAPKNLRASGKALCLGCHEKKVAAEKGVLPARSIDTGKQFAHEPFARRDCQACHQPGHGAKHKKLLRAAPAELCYGCHERKDGERYLHSAVVLGDCAVCHEVHTSDNAALLTEGSTSRLCFRCHQDDLTGRTWVHKPAGEGKCDACHDPHGSKYPFNLVESGKRELCAGCHEEAKREVKVKHAPLQRYGCGACHDPHGTGNPSQLLKPVNELCSGCHPRYPDGLHATSIVAGGHLVSGDFDPRREGRAFSCASCHDPHGSDNDQLFYFGKGLVMCDGCHGDRTGKNKELKDITRRRPGQAGTPSGSAPAAKRPTPSPGLDPSARSGAP